jgi:Helicase HerA, central domain
MTVVATSSPTPGLLPDAYGDPSPTTYFGIEIVSAVNLLEAREYEGLQRGERLSKALSEQQGFLSGLLDPSLRAAYDLRVLVRPDSATPLSVVLLGRVWGSTDQSSLNDRSGELARHVQALLPRHVNGEIMDDQGRINRALSPFSFETPIDSATITKREEIALPTRPDAKVAYYFSVVPFTWVENDWTNVYSALAASPVPLVLSVGVIPLELPAAFSQRLQAIATHYGRLASEDQREGGLFYGTQRIPPDAFARDAERTFSDYARRYRGRAYALRVQVAAEERLPPGALEAVAAAISPPESEPGSQLERERAHSAYEIRRVASDYDRQLAEWNLRTVDFRLPRGNGAIWDRPDPPPKDLQLLCILADAQDASCGLRFPIALDGTVPGFRVRRGEFGHVEQYSADGPAITLGMIPGGGAPIQLSLRSLTKHALIAGSTGSGKTTTVLEFLRQLWLDHRVPFLVIEPVNSDANDYRRLLDEPGFEAVEVITVGDETSRPLRFNPFEVPQNVMVGEHSANLLAAFKAAFGLWEPLPSIYQDALNLTYLRAGILSSERSTGEPREWPTAVEFMQAMTEVTAELGYAGELRHNIEAASVRRAQQLASGVSASAFLTNRPNNIGGLLDHPVILELRTLGSGDEQALMMALLLNAITEYYQAVRGASPDLIHVTVVEEAHRLLERPSGGKDEKEGQAKEKAAQAFANTLAENRKYGEGMVIAEQIPTKLVEDAVKNTNLKVMHRLTAEEDRKYLGESMGFDEPQLRFATRLKTGEALTYSDEFAEAMLVEVKPLMRSADPGVLASRGSPPFAACERCPAQCIYRGAALAMVRDPGLVHYFEQIVAVLEKRELEKAEAGDAWRQLIDGLRLKVSSFAALPSSEPEVSNAAYCLFLHTLAIRTTRFSPAWSAAVANQLGISEPRLGGQGMRYE